MGKIIKSTTTADKVLIEVRKIVKASNLEFWLQPYQNGREHGWSLLNLSGKTAKQVSFAEFRNSDSIVLYCGTTMDFEMAGNIPSDDIYSVKEFFSYGNYKSAAKRIVEWLK